MSKIMEDFKNPPKGYGIVPFYWWIGDKLTKERIRWQLDKMKNHSLTGLQINYAHDYTGGISYGLSYKSDPPLFTEEWWELYSWFLEQGKEDGFSVSLSDYTLGVGQGFFMDEVIEDKPYLRGKTLEIITSDYYQGEKINISIPTEYLSVYLIKDKNCFEIKDKIKNHSLNISCDADCTIMIIYTKVHEYSLDPMHPESGMGVCNKFFDKFTKHFPDEGGKGLNFFFSDELNFGVSGNLWNDYFKDEFIKIKGYDIIPYLPALFTSIGEFTAKYRLDYKDVIVRLEEKNYFEVVYKWHEDRNMIYGCDHGGRGYDVTEFGDYFRTQKYNQGPGCDQPMLQYNIVKNKVAASIAHLYNRPRVWLEGFHSSGWGTSSADLTKAIAQNYVMGHNLLSLHGMYYTTHGGFWEWASPCNTFRMPYWDDISGLLKAVERMSYILSSGTHVCDVGIIYPVSAVEGGFDGEKSVETAFECCETLYKSGIDLDFIDFESIVNAKIENEKLKIAGEEFSVIIVPSMKTVRYDMVKKLLDFKNAGGIVINIGDLPIFSDNLNRNEFKNVINNLFNTDSLLLPSNENIVKVIKDLITTDINVNTEDEVYINHRKIENKDLYMIFGAKKGTKCFFRAKGYAYLLNPYDGRTYELDNQETTTEGTYVYLPLNHEEFQLIVFDKSDYRADDMIDNLVYQNLLHLETIELDTNWNFKLLPYLDNTFGDYAMPATNELIGAQARTFKYYNSNDDELPKDDKFNQSGIYSYGTYYLYQSNFSSETAYLTCINRALRNDLYSFKEYDISLRYGKYNDHGIQGHHGLKKVITDQYLTIGKQSNEWLGLYYVDDKFNFGLVISTNVICEEETNATILYGDVAPEELYINSKKITNLNEPVLLKQGVNVVIAGFKKAGRSYLLFAKDDLTKATKKQEFPLAMKWYKNESILPLDALITDSKRLKKFGYYQITLPPATKEVFVPAYEVTKAWVNNLACGISQVEGGFIITPDAINKTCCNAVIQVPLNKGLYKGAVFSDVIKICCADSGGIIKTGDWCKQGLSSYSGGVEYSQDVDIYKLEKIKYVISIEHLISSVKVYVNDQYVDTKVSPPYDINITDYVVRGINNIKLVVHNTLSNHYETIPTKYKGDDSSGILGNVVIKTFG